MRFLRSALASGRASAPRVGLVLLLGALASCAINPEKDEKAWKDVLAKGVPAPAAHYDPARPLSLTHALALANARNDSLAVTGEDYVQALVTEDRAASAFVPTVALAPVYSRQEKTKIGAGSSFDVGSIVPSRTFDVPVKADLTVNPPQAVHAESWAEETAAARRAELLNLRSAVLLDVARTFYAVTTAEARAVVLRKSVAVAKRRLADVKAKEEAGVVATLEVSRARAEVAKIQALLIDAENAAGNGRTTLARLIGVSAVRGELSDDVHVPAKPGAADTYVAAAASRRQDLVAAEDRTRAAAAGVKAAFSEYFPTISLDFTRFFHRESFPSDVDWSTALGANLPILSGGQIEDDIRAAYSKFRQAKAAEDYVRGGVTEQVRNAYRDLADSRRRIQALTDQVAAAADAHRNASAGYEQGVTSDLDRLVAEDDLRTARLSLATERIAETLRWLRLLRTSGELESRIFPAPKPAPKPVPKPAG